MLRIAGRGLSRVLCTSLTQPGHSGSASVATVLSSPRCLHDTGDCYGDFGIATGVEREELEWKRQGKSRFYLSPPRGPFGTKGNVSGTSRRLRELVVNLAVTNIISLSKTDDYPEIQ
ncbi:uncharacterized protein [Physcomitrium patens]|uniref:Uncharacterized protein n=1 Tax=Physcomitrium patens TaxID=3218 RepID=A0A2K1IY52_PHYPA|nr:uncharacterized protein LOC112296099 isoform X2 [Physcomitrium patens]PNR34204.1 hypothetical protein PHYPA_024021 [Physcomitrium patens]|eukprot:XP_024404031.1 uncharacterized protein LOC112296099 isoform X2 [Physcomitrella patens]